MVVVEAPPGQLLADPGITFDDVPPEPRGDQEISFEFCACVADCAAWCYPPKHRAQKKTEMYRLPSEIRTYRRKWGVAIVGFGAIVLAIGPALDQVPKMNSWSVPVIYASFIIIGIGALHWLVALFWPMATSEAYDCRQAMADEIPKMLRFAEKYMGPVGMPTEEFLRGLLSASPGLYYIVEDKRTDDNLTKMMVGCFTILPLKAGVVRRLEDGELHGSGIKAEDLTKKRRTAKGLYVGIVIGSDRFTSGITLKHLSVEIYRLCKTHNTVKVFARPVTDDGLRILRKHKFKNVISGNEPEMNVVCRKLWE